MRNHDIKELLAHCSTEIKQLSEQVETGQPNKVLIKNALENLRSSLDYLANDILKKLNSHGGNKNPLKKNYFPYGQKENHFRKSVNNNLPSLKQYEPEIYDAIEEIQPFRSKDNWIFDLCTLTNDAKHNNLSKTETRSNTVVKNAGFYHIEGCKNGVISNCYVDGVRQDDVFIDGSGVANIVKYSGTTIVFENNKILFLGKELEVTYFLTHCLKNIESLVVVVDKLLR